MEDGPTLKAPSASSDLCLTHIHRSCTKTGDIWSFWETRMPRNSQNSKELNCLVLLPSVATRFYARLQIFLAQIHHVKILIIASHLNIYCSAFSNFTLQMEDKHKWRIYLIYAPYAQKSRRCLLQHDWYNVKDELRVFYMHLFCINFC